MSPTDLLLLMAMTTENAVPNSASSLATRVKVNRVSMWGPMAADLKPVTVALDWEGSTTNLFSGNSRRITDTSMSATYCARLSSKPPKNSVCSGWVPTSAQSLFELVYPENAIIDLHLSFALRDDLSESTPSIAVSEVATAGVFGSVAIGNLVPVGLVQL